MQKPSIRSNRSLPKAWAFSAACLAGLLTACVSDSPGEKILPGAWTEQREAQGQFLIDIMFIDQKTGWVCGWSDSLGGFVLRTRDGGLDWDTTLTGVDEVLEAIRFRDKNTGWVAGSKGSIRKTTDGGVTWTAQASGVETRLRGIAFVSHSTGWVVGDEGVILKTTDGGNSWAGQHEEDLPYLNDVHFFDANTGIAVGHSVLRTTDGGAHWNTQTVNWGNPQMFNFITSISFSDDKNGWAGGSFGNFLRTTDGGKTWNGEILPYDSYVMDVWKFGSGRGFMTRGLTIFETTDDGETWEGVEASGHDLFFLGINRGWAVGDNGTVHAYAPEP